MAEETTTSAKVQAKRQRAQLLVEVTEVEKTLRNAIQSNAPHQSIETELEKLHRAFTKFKGSHLECIAVLNDTDISAKLAADFERARMSYEKCAEETSEHLKQGSPDEQSPDPPTGGTDLTQLFAQMQKQMTKAFEHHIQKQREHAEASQQKMHQEIQQQIKELRQEFASKNTQNSETEEQNSQYSSTHSETQNFTSAPSAPANVLSGTPTAPQTSTPVSTEEVLLKIASTLQYVQRNSTLPKQELLTFSGNPLDYTKFIHNFETFIASQFLDDSEKLQYLVQQCRGEARRRIDDYITVRPASEGYKQALNMLKTDYGRPYVISRAYVDQLTKGNPIRGNDAEALRSLAVDMKKCELNLSQTGFSSDIDNSENIKRIVHRLPNYMRTRWTEVAFGINESGREPNFKDLVKFVDERSRVASSMYGMDYAQDERKQRPKSHKESTKPRTTTLSTHASKGTRKNCAYCDSSCNGVSNCRAFSELKLTDRVSAVKRLRLCINCLWSNHFVSECKYAPQCKEPNCGKKHHRLLHGWTPKKQVEKSVETSVSAATAGGSKKTAFLGIIPVRVEGRGGRVVETYALLDNGSQQSFCSEELLLKLGIKGKAINYTVTTLTSQKQRYRGREANLTVKSLSGSNTAHLSGVWTVKNLAISTRLAAKPSDIKGYAHLADLDIPEIEDCDVALLIGGDSEAQIPIEVRSSGIAGEPYAERNLLGWVVRGPSNKQQSKAIHVNFLQTGTLQENLEKMWRTDFSERCDTDEVGWSVDDKRAAKIMSDTISIDDGHYKLALPWQDKTFVPPNNKVQAYARLNQLKRRLERDPELHAKYTEQMNQYLDKGHAEAAPLSKKHDRTWYLPHQPVTNPNKPDKVRIVFDGASKFQGTSLNDQLLQGPDYFNSLIGILLRFRQGHVAIAGDIESMFHQVKVADEDRNALRFLWWENGDLTKSPNEYRMAVHIFGAKSSPSCTTFALRKTANDNKSKYSEITVNSVSKSFYVDDFLKSLDDEGAVVDLARELRQLLKCGGFRLTKFLSNRQNVINSIPASERAASVQNASLCDEQPNERALGVRWDVHDDKLTYDAKVPDKPVTRRGILAAVSSLFDPLGLAAPVTLKAKAVLQELCRMQLSWDSEIPESERIKWHNWLKALPSLRAVRIPRCYKPIGFGKVIDIQLHIFCDASENGYGACAYLRFTNQHGAVCVSLAFGKSRLAPLKQVSIPRLELTAAVLASRLCAQIHREVEFEISQTILWTDSMIALSYIKNKSRRFKVFVANRLAIIHENTKESQWRHVPTQSNPADIASRGLDPDDKTKLNVWLNGPVFLQQGEENWPAVINIPLVPEQDTETKKASVNAIAEHDDPINKLFMKFSDWHKLKRATCWILRFQKYCLQRYLKRRVEVRNTELSVEEISAASRSVISYVQQQCFTDEMDKLQVRKPVSKDSRLVSLCPFYEHGLLRVGGLLQFSSLTDQSKCPVILPDKHPITSLIIDSLHRKNGHIGINQVLANSRENYWILRGRSAIKSVLNRCFECKRRNQRASQQQMAPLRQERMTPDKPPFSFVGIDYFGPLIVKVARSNHKRYGVIFTCLATRAVHLEVAHTLDTDSFLAAFQRFVSRRGRPLKVFSDNGTNLTSGERELKEAIQSWNQRTINDRLLQQEISWHFNPPHASHAGGVWERLIRSVRRILKSIVREQLLNDESLLTLITEVEKILNDRPITYVSNDASDPEPLSPSKLLLLRDNSCLPYGIFDKKDTYARRWWRQVQYMASIFWRRWLREYLPALQAREKWQRSHRSMREGDVVLIGDENVPRGEWPIGRVTSVNIGRDGLVRSCTVKTARSELVRPIVKLYLLEGSD